MASQEYNPISEEHNREAARRAIARRKRMVNLETRLAQENLDFLGRALSGVRRLQRKSLENVAESISISPSLLCFLESGLGTAEEFAISIDRWAEALNQDIELCLGYIPNEVYQTTRQERDDNHKRNTL